VVDDPAKMIGGGDPQLDAAIAEMTKAIAERGRTERRPAPKLNFDRPTKEIAATACSECDSFFKTNRAARRWRQNFDRPILERIGRRVLLRGFYTVAVAGPTVSRPFKQRGN
jgi:hypothetical protein